MEAGFGEVGPACQEVVKAGTAHQRRLAGKYGQALAWLETFVERGRFAGTCYKAANWVHVGVTRGRGRQDRKHSASVPEKDVYLVPVK